jgi:hypothetical protein
MAEPAEVVRIVVKAELDAASQRATEAGFDQSMNKMTASAGKAETVVTGTANKMAGSLKTVDTGARQAGAGVQQMAQMLNAGKAPLASMTEQAISMAGALGGGGGAGAAVAGGAGRSILGAATRVIGFFGGPWGIGLAAAGFALTAFMNRQKDEASQLDEIFDKLVKSKEQSELNRQADERWANSLGGLIEAQRKLNTELDKRLSSQSKLADQAIAEQALRASQLNAYADRVAADPTKSAEVKKTARDLASQANVNLFNMQAEAARNLGKAYGDAGNAAALWGQKQADTLIRIVQTHPELQSQQHLLEGANNQLLASMQAASSAGQSFGATGRAARGLNDQLLHGKITAAAYVEQIKALARALDAQAEAAKKAKSASGRGSGLSGREVSASEAAAIARGAGLQVNSSTRTYGQQKALYDAWVAQGKPKDNPVAPPGSSAHEGARGRWALDIQFGQGVTPDLLRKVFAAQGVNLTKVFKERGHFHVEGSRSQAAGAEREAERDATRTAMEAERAAAERAQQKARFDTEMGQLDEQMLAASTTRATTMEEQLNQELAAIDASTKRTNEEYRIAEGLGRLAEGDAELLIGKNNQVAQQRKAQLVADDQQRIAEMNRQLALEAQDNVVAEASYQMSIAKTAEDRLAANMRLLDAEHERERLALQAILDATKDGEAQHELAELRMAELDRQRARNAQDARSDPANKSPMDKYRDDLHKTAGQIDEDLQQITVDGLESFNDGLTDAIMGAKSLGEVFDDVANQIIRALVRIAIQQLIIKPLADLLGAGMSSGGGGGGYQGVLGSLITGLIPHASGGAVSPGKGYWVGEHGPEPFFPAQHGQIMPNHEAAKLLGANSNDNRPNVSLMVNAPGATAETVAMIRRELANAAPTIVAAAQRSTIAQLQRPRT